MPAKLQVPDYYRMECATVPCPACGAVRGELCRGKNVAHYHGSGHSDRKAAFRQWAYQNKTRYKALKEQARNTRIVPDPNCNELYMGEN